VEIAEFASNNQAILGPYNSALCLTTLSGSWEYVFAPAAGGTVLTITEKGEVSNPLFRFMSRYIFGQTATIDTYLKSLAKHFGEAGTPGDPAGGK